MILHKENTLRAESFLSSISDISQVEEEYSKPEYGSSELKQLEKYSYFIQNLMAFEKEIKDDNNVKILMERFQIYLKKIIPVKAVSLLFYNEFKRELVPIDEEDDLPMVKTMNHFNQQGIFTEIYSDKKTMTVPELESYNSDGPKLFYLIFPVYDDNKNNGILSILTSLNANSISELEKKNINMFLNLLVGKLEKLRLTEKLNETYEELQTYQAKLSNDFRLSAIGELTEGIVEDIVTPLQVISSEVDILKSDLKNSIELSQIKTQIKKINVVIGRLVKFADVNQKDVKIKPCNLNEIIKDYFHLIKSTLENANFECILDFENELPSILSHPNYIYQLLTNIFSVIKSYKTRKGGIILQTRYKSDNIILRVITTSGISDEEIKKGDNVQQNLSLSIIKNLMKKHEGKLEFDSFENSGAALVLKFPLKRKIRK
ncbi:MAG: HAMP domain-containing histidine kinase [Ignavibacteriales bacterium]|nr:HAMP domain-containing histidine kinase [Ignavibacteriota bacterium]MCB9248040.1 HAMP domain-containing histidine kinase [Ignavibacteriales bacterium]